MRIILFFLFSSCCVASLIAQDELSIEQCLELVSKNEKRFANQTSAIQAANLDQKFNNWSLLPNLSLSPNYNVSFGRKLDPFTNTFGVNTVYSNSYSLQYQLPIFQGFKYFRSKKMYASIIENSTLVKTTTIENAKQQMLDKYFEVLKIQVKLNNQDQVIEQLKLFKARQIELVKEGRLSAIDTLETSVNEKNQKMTLLSLNNQLKSETIRINYLLGLPLIQETKIKQEIEECIIKVELDEYYQLLALQQQKEVSLLQQKVQNSQLFPSLSTYGNIGTGFSTNNLDYTQESLPVIRYDHQIQNNLNSGIGVSLNLPIFNQGAMLKNQKLSDINQKQLDQNILDQQQLLEQRKLEIEQQQYFLKQQLEIQKMIVSDKESLTSIYESLYLEGKIRITEFEKIKNDYLMYQNSIQEIELDMLRLSI